MMAVLVIKPVTLEQSPKRFGYQCDLIINLTSSCPNTTQAFSQVMHLNGIQPAGERAD